MARLLLALVALAAASRDAPKMELVLDDVPSLDDFLEGVGLTSHLDNFIAAGYTETQYVLRMKEMDLRINSRVVGAWACSG